MSAGHKTAYLKYRRFLAARQRDADDSVDIRDVIMARRKTRTTIGYIEQTLQRAVGSNMRLLFTF